MISQIFSVYDKKAEAYCHPFYSGSSVIAERHFANAANDRESAICRNPGDYNLFLLGSFDDESGELVVYANQQNLGSALKHVKKD